MSQQEGFYDNFRKFVEWAREPVEDRFASESLGQIFANLSELEREALLLCVVYLNAKYDRKRLSDAEFVKPQLDRSIRASNIQPAFVRAGYQVISEDLFADEAREQVFSSLDEKQFKRYCQMFDSSLSILDYAL